MTSKTQKHKSTRIVSYTLITCVLLLVCTGCRKDTGARGRQTEFEIDKDYQRGPLTVHVRADKSNMTIAETFCLEFETAIEPGFEVQMPNVDKVLENFSIVDWDNCSQKIGDHPCDFTLIDQDGKEFNLYDHVGTIIIIDLSAMWCGPCQMAAIEVEDLQGDYGDDMIFGATGCSFLST